MIEPKIQSVEKAWSAFKGSNPQLRNSFFKIETAMRTNPGNVPSLWDELIKEKPVYPSNLFTDPEHLKTALLKLSTAEQIILGETLKSQALQIEAKKQEQADAQQEKIKKARRRVPVVRNIPAERLSRAIKRDVVNKLSEGGTSEAYRLSEKAVFEEWVKSKRSKKTTLEEYKKTDEYQNKVDALFEKKMPQEVKAGILEEKARTYLNPNDDPAIKEYKKMLAELQKDKEKYKIPDKIYEKRKNILRNIFIGELETKAGTYGLIPVAGQEQIATRDVQQEPTSSTETNTEQVEPPDQPNFSQGQESEPLSPTELRQPSSGPPPATPTPSSPPGGGGGLPRMGNPLGNLGKNFGNMGNNLQKLEKVAKLAKTVAGAKEKIIILLIIFALILVFLIISYIVNLFQDEKALIISKSADKTEVANPKPNSTDSDITYTISVSYSANQGQIVISDPIPDNAVFVSASDNPELLDEDGNPTTDNNLVRDVRWTLQGGGDGGVPGGSGAIPATTVKAEFINELLAGSGLAGMGQVIENAAKETNVPWDLGLAILLKENSWYKSGIGACLVDTGTNNPGSLNWGSTNEAKCKKDSANPDEVKMSWCKDRNYCKYPTLADGTAAVYRHLNRTDLGYRALVDQYIRTGDPMPVLMKYAPPAENQTELYRKQVMGWIKDWNEKAKAAGALSNTFTTELIAAPNTPQNASLADWLNKKLSEDAAHSGLKGMGSTLVQFSAKYNVPIELALGQFRLETQWYSDNGVTVTQHSNNPGNISCQNGLRLGATGKVSTSMNSYCVFSSLEAGIEAYFKLLNENYRDRVDHFISTGDPSKVIEKYYSSANDESGGNAGSYVSVVNKIVKSLRDSAAKDSISLTATGGGLGQSDGDFEITTLSVTLTLRPKPNAIDTYIINQATAESSGDGGEESGSVCTGGGTVVIDPGHSGKDSTRMDPETNIIDHDYPSATSEMKDVFEVATNLKSKLESAGYKVVMTKNSVNDSVSHRQRAEIANSNNAAIAVSIHTDQGANSFGKWGQVFAQKVGLYRNSGQDGKGTPVKFADQAIADLSQKYSNTIAQTRTAIEGVTVTNVVNSFDGRKGLAGGNIPLVQLFSKVPWVYNEAGGPLNADQKNKYAQGIYDGIVKSVSPDNSGTGCTTTNSFFPVKGTQTAYTGATEKKGAGDGTSTDSNRGKMIIAPESSWFFEWPIPAVQYSFEKYQGQSVDSNGPGFHACRGTGCNRPHRAVDIYAYFGTPIVAPEDGVVFAIGGSNVTASKEPDSGGAGRWLAFKGKSGKVYRFMHTMGFSHEIIKEAGLNGQQIGEVSRKDVNIEVQGGYTIAYVGNTGGIQNPHLNFEIYPDVSMTAGTEIDPTSFLNASLSKTGTFNVSSQ